MRSTSEESCSLINQPQLQAVAGVLAGDSGWRSILRGDLVIKNEIIINSEHSLARADIRDIIFDVLFKWSRSIGPISACQMYSKLEKTDHKFILIDELLLDHDCSFAMQGKI